MTDLVLLGAGHAHLEVLKRFAMRPEPGLRITLIGREPETPYSGMLPGLIRRDYRFEEAHIDLAPVAAASGARLVMAEATGINLGARTVSLDGRPEIPFDLLSADVGGLPAMPPGAGVPVKPIGRFLTRLEELEAHLRPGAHVAVVGAGPAGTELALALARRFGASVRIALVCSESEPIPLAPARARIIARAALVDAGVEMVFRVTAVGYEGRRLALSDGSFLEADEALWATGVVAPEFLAASGLACDPTGCIRVDRTLRSLSHPFVFAAGDCASVDDAPRPKAGVWAVRAGKPLAANLRRAARGRRLRAWRPQSEALVILGLGDGRALAWRNGIAVSGEWVWCWKDHIDRRWMRMYQKMKPMAEDPDQPMRCGGCGAKVGAEVLESALTALARPESPDILVGLDRPDDAAVALPPRGAAVVQSVDHFRAFLDDPYVFGQIAAAHALSDLHAMGVRPWTALAIASVPHMPAEKMRTELRAMLQGAAEILEADGCALVGGHSGESAEPALGFAVTGLADPAQLMRKSGLRVGDVLVLTKPLGTGIILAANMRGRCKASWLNAAIGSMRRSNADAARVLRAHGVNAATDVTGFGLGGHLIEMLRASSVGATLDVDAIPALPGARELAAEGIASTLAPDNLRVLRRAGITVLPELALLTDPQTSGGLLAGVAPERVAECLRAMRSTGLEVAVIGEVFPAQADAVLIALRPDRSGPAL